MDSPAATLLLMVSSRGRSEDWTCPSRLDTSGFGRPKARPFSSLFAPACLQTEGGRLYSICEWSPRNRQDGDCCGGRPESSVRPHLSLSASPSSTVWNYTPQRMCALSSHLRPPPPLRSWLQSRESSSDAPSLVCPVDGIPWCAFRCSFMVLCHCIWSASSVSLSGLWGCSIFTYNKETTDQFAHDDFAITFNSSACLSLVPRVWYSAAFCTPGNGLLPLIIILLHVLYCFQTRACIDTTVHILPVKIPDAVSATQVPSAGVSLASSLLETLFIITL